ncbi:MAG: C45 family peptidase [Candidatus Omnitrophica bacterium]|nr:C45 family peptidase [Candidatus Omnitrophota bacterium]
MADGKRYSNGKMNVLELSGDYREMGRQYGKLFKDQIVKFYERAIEGYFIKNANMPYLRLLAISRLIFRRYPPKIKEIFNGISEISGISLNRIIMLDQINTFEFIRNQNLGRCSNMAVWGDYTEDGSLVFGRNFDQPEYFKNFNDFLALTIFSPDDGIPTASIGYAGQIGISAALNRQGVFIANNEAPTMKSDGIEIKTPSVLVLELEFLMSSSGLDGLDRLIKGAKANCPIIVSAGDNKRSYTYEWTVSGMKRRSEDKNGILVSTNHFAHPSWSRPALLPGSYVKTLERRANLLSLGEKHKGKFNIQKMKEVLDTTVDKGGATHVGQTTFQMIIVPDRLEMHVKIPDFQDWTEFDLKAPLTRHALTGDAAPSLQ